MRNLHFSSDSVPWDKNTLWFKSIFSFGNMLSEDLTIVSNVSLEVVDEEWLGEIILVVCVWHSFEIEGHWSTWFNISDFVASTSGVGISVEESCGDVLVFWEKWINSSFIPFLIIIDNMIGFRGEKAIQFLISKNGIKKIDLINGWLSTLVSNSSCEGKSSNEEMDFPDESLRGHQETEGGITS